MRDLRETRKKVKAGDGMGVGSQYQTRKSIMNDFVNHIALIKCFF